MWNGFYDLSSITDLEILKQLYRDCLALSTKSTVDILIPGKMARENYPDLSPSDYIDKEITLKTHNVFINRKEYYKVLDFFDDNNGEVGSCSYNTSLYLFIYLTIDNLNLIRDKYKLIKKEY